jgi:hypothetical protein
MEILIFMMRVEIWLDNDANFRLIQIIGVIIICLWFWFRAYLISKNKI